MCKAVDREIRIVGHQNAGVQATFAFRQRFAQPVRVTPVIILAKEAWLPIVAALDNVQRDTIKLDARLPDLRSC